MTIDAKKGLVYLLPVVLLLTTSAAFYFLSKCFGKQTGYFLGFLFYWLFWCTGVPVLLIGRKAIAHLFKRQKPWLGEHKLRNIIFLVLPLLLVYWYEFPKVLNGASTIIVFSSLVISVINATAEEILWRGTFLKFFSNGSRIYIIYSSLGFAAWHFAPQIVFSNQQPGGSLSFVAVAFILGLLYSAVVQDTRSTLLTVFAHFLFDFSGLGGRIYF